MALFLCRQEKYPKEADLRRRYEKSALLKNPPAASPELHSTIRCSMCKVLAFCTKFSLFCSMEIQNFYTNGHVASILPSARREGVLRGRVAMRAGASHLNASP